MSICKLPTILRMRLLREGRLLLELCCSLGILGIALVCLPQATQRRKPTPWKKAPKLAMNILEIIERAERVTFPRKRKFPYFSRMSNQLEGYTAGKRFKIESEGSGVKIRVLSSRETKFEKFWPNVYFRCERRWKKTGPERIRISLFDKEANYIFSGTRLGIHKEEEIRPL